MTFIIALALILTQCEKDQNNEIKLTNQFTDTAFFIALIEQGVDTNGDSLISYSEAEAVTSLDIAGYEGGGVWGPNQSRGIENMKGIELFVNLDTLDCSVNDIVSLDLSQNASLTYLRCSWNQLSNLDVSNCTGLKKVDCPKNQLTSLDVSNNTALTFLRFSSNQLTSLDVSNCPHLIDLRAYGNPLTSLDVSKNTALKNLLLGNNLLTSLDVSSNIALQWLIIGETPTLHKVCVWTTPFPPDGVTVWSDDSPNVYFTTDCSK